MNRKFLPLIGISGIAILISLLMIAVGIWRAAAYGAWDMLSAGMTTLVVAIASVPLALILARIGSDLHGMADTRSTAVNERLEQFAVLLSQIAEQQLLSDRAKSVAYREKDRDALRRAIQEEINRGDWDAAIRLADEIETQFGYRTEAARFREDVRQRQQEHVRKQIQDVVMVIDRYTRSEQWNGALREAERLMGMFPDNEQVKGLPQEIDRRRQEHKKRLIDSWNDAVTRRDIDGSIEILRQLDTYLTPAEAEGFQETARRVFDEKRNQLGKQFADAVHDKKWVDAIRTGETIIREFPNSRMAQEVREKMDSLRARAAENGVIVAPPPTINVLPPAAVITPA